MKPMGQGAGKGGGSPCRLHPPRKAAGWQQKGMQWEELAANGDKCTGVKGLQVPRTVPPWPKDQQDPSPTGEN